MIQSFKKRAAIVLMAIALVVSAGFMGGPRPAYATDYSVAVSSADPSSSGTNYTANGGPLISGNAYLRQFTIGNYLGAGVQNVTIWDLCGSSTTAVARFTIPVAASATYTSAVFPANGILLNNPCISKTDANSTVRITLDVD
jgi:hypothetical protein